MRALICILIIITYSPLLFSMSCREYEKVADYLNTKKFVKASREYRILKKEPLLNLGDINQARAISYRFPAFEDFGFGRPGGPGWTVYKGRHPKSVLNGKDIGWEIKNSNGHARVRLDWDPDKGAHYNIEITKKALGKTENHKLAVSFLCGNAKCTEQQLLKIADRLQ